MNTDPVLSADEIDCLRCVAGQMIPASATHNVPGADDAAIVADMVRSLGRDREPLRTLLARIQEAAGGSLAALSGSDRAAALDALRRPNPAAFAVVEAVVSRAYYRDDRVLASIGMPVRAPFPTGFQVDQIDMSLLDPVKARGKAFRDAD